LIVEPSATLQAFLRDFITSYEELEVLLLLARNGDRWWSTAELAEALKIRDDGAEAAVERLAGTGRLVDVVQRAGATRFRYGAQDDLTRRLVVELDTSYTEHRLTIVQLMSKYALDRMRGAAARRLADAFSIERPKR
jgi:hypothetical protein